MARSSKSRIVGELNADGHFTGRYTETKGGGLQYGLRRAYARVFSKDELSRLTQALANGVFSGASGDSLKLFDGRDLQAKPQVTLLVHDAPAGMEGRAAAQHRGIESVRQLQGRVRPGRARAAGHAPHDGPARHGAAGQCRCAHRLAARDLQGRREVHRPATGEVT